MWSQTNKKLCQTDTVFTAFTLFIRIWYNSMYLISHWVYFPFSLFSLGERKMPSKKISLGACLPIAISQKWLLILIHSNTKTQYRWGEEAAGKAFLVRHQCLAKDTIWKYLARRAWTDRCVMADLGDIFGPIEGARRNSVRMDSITQSS